MSPEVIASRIVEVPRRMATNARMFFTWRRGRSRPPALPMRSTLQAVGLVLVATVLMMVAFDARIMAAVATQPDRIDVLFGAITRYGKSDWILFPTAVLALIGGAADWRRCRPRYAAAWSQILAFAVTVFIVVAASGLLTNVLKPLFGRLRPIYADHVLHFAPFTFGDFRFASFPSGHSTVMGAMAVVIAFGPRWLRVPGLIAAGVVAISRVMVSAHYPSDVVAGLAVGAAVTFLIIRAFASFGFGFERRDGVIRWRFGALCQVARQSGPILHVVLLTALVRALGFDRSQPSDDKPANA